MKLSEVEELHTRYLIGFWRRSYFARKMRLTENDEDPPIVNELKNLLFWTSGTDGGDIDETVLRIRHADGLSNLIASAERTIQEIAVNVEAGTFEGTVQDALKQAQEQLDIANSARTLLEIMTSG